MLSITSDATSRQFAYQYMNTEGVLLKEEAETHTIEGEGFTARVRENGFFAQAVLVDYSIPRPQIETLLFGKGYDLRGCEWKFTPSKSTPTDYLPDASELPHGRVQYGAGYRASVRRTEQGHEVIYLDGTDPEAGIEELTRKGVKFALGCKVWKVPAREPSPNPNLAIAPHRAKFFGVFRGNEHLFNLSGLDMPMLKKYYRWRFNVKQMREATVTEWAIAAAEMAFMVDNVSILSERAHEIRRVAKGGVI